MESNSYRLYSGLPGLTAHKSYAEIDLDRLSYNYRLLTKDLPEGFTVISVVKADAYCHGAAECVKTLLGEGCRAFAVSCIEEAVDVRNICRGAGMADSDVMILILGYTFPGQAHILSEFSVTQALVSEEYAKALDTEAKSSGVTVYVHAAIDTGMNRVGFPAHSDSEIDEAADGLERVSKMKNLKLSGMFTHFACVNEPVDDATATQYGRYDKLLGKLLERGIKPEKCHVCNSAAAVEIPEYHLDAVRQGLLLYGYAPKDAITIPVKPVMKMKTVISHVHTLLAGESVGYGATFTAERDMKIATLPIGYADGFIRGYKGGEVTVHTRNGDGKARLIGRICMDQCMIDVSGIDCRVGDNVTLFGNEQSDLFALCERGNTIPHEALCLVSARMPRVYIKNGKGI